MTAEIRELLVRAAEFLDNYADVEDGDYGVPRPNVAMALARDIEEALTAPREKP